jgi:hypothetical protein
MSAVLHSWWTRYDAPDRRPELGADDVGVTKNAGARVARPEEVAGGGQEAGHMALRTRP